MGSSGPGPVRASEAHARAAALERIGYVGRLDDDGYPIDGRGAPLRGWDMANGDGHRVSNMRAVGVVEWDAYQAATRGGGSARPGPGEDSGLDNPMRAWPRGYRRDGEGR
jgi:hypothetical protein